MPFGLRYVALTFQQFINHVLQGLPYCYAYIDYLLVASTSPEEHQQHLRQVRCLLHYGNTPEANTDLLINGAEDKSFRIEVMALITK